MNVIALFLAATLNTVSVHPLIRAERANPLRAIDAHIEVAPDQQLGASGLRFTVVYRNIGPDAIEIVAPDQTTDVSLIDERQTVLEMPSALEQLFVNPGAQRTVTIAPGGEYRLEMSVGDVIAASAQTRTPLRIAKGKYEVRVFSPIIASARNASGSRWMRSYQSEWFRVRLQ